MPKIVRFGGINLTDEAVKIRDMGPVAPPAKKHKVVPFVVEDEDGEFFVPPDPGENGVDAPGAGPLAEKGAGAGAFTDAATRKEIVQSAMAEAAKILQDALGQAERQKAGVLAGIEAEAGQMRENAVNEGCRQGLAAAAAEVRQLADGIQKSVARFEGERAGFEAEHEEQLRWLAMEIASKVLAKRVADDDAELLEMVDKAVASVRAESWIRVEVAQEMARLIEGLQNLYAGQDNIEVSGVPAPAGFIQIETPSGVIDAALKTQLENLRAYFVHNTPGAQPQPSAERGV